MSSGIEPKDSTFSMSAKNVKKMAESLEVEEVFGSTSLNMGSKETHIERVQSMFEWIGYEVDISEDGGVVGLNGKGECSNHFWKFFEVLAPLVNPGSYLGIEEFMEPARLVFDSYENGDFLKTITPKIIWENDIEEKE